jgi:hypothetical protein
MYFTGRCAIECGIGRPQPDDGVVGAGLPRHSIDLGLRSPRGPLATSGRKSSENPARDGLRLAGQIISRDFPILGRCRERLEALAG